MFPLLPALILLLLQGQPALERGRAPTTFEDLSWQIVSRQIDRDGKGANPPLAEVCALLRMLNPKVEPAPVLDADADSSPHDPVQRGSIRLSEGFAKSQRSRDGPRFSV